jgi:glycosyltransferase involved in cell wall biosynthesis
MQWAISQRRWRKRLYGSLDRRRLAASLLHATSQEEAHDLRNLGFQHVVVIPNGVDYEFLREPSQLDIRSRFGLPRDASIVAWMGRFSEVKNLGVLIDATHNLGVHLVVAGDNDNACGHTMRDRVRRQGRSDVHFVGYLDETTKRALLQQAAVYAHPSLMESYGMSIAEALAAGCPVVASTATPWAVLKERGAGRWVPPDVLSFRDAISSIIRASSEELRRAALTLASEHAWPSRAKALLAAYEAFRTKSKT